MDSSRWKMQIGTRTENFAVCLKCNWQERMIKKQTGTWNRPGSNGHGLKFSMPESDIFLNHIVPLVS